MVVLAGLKISLSKSEPRSGMSGCPKWKSLSIGAFMSEGRGKHDIETWIGIAPVSMGTIYHSAVVVCSCRFTHLWSQVKEKDHGYKWLK